MNQCDGCNRGLPVFNGIHYKIDIRKSPEVVMCCSADKYDHSTAKTDVHTQSDNDKSTD